MSNPPVTARQLEQLFQNLEDCQITGAEHAQLMGLLRENSGIRSAYIDHMEFVGLLHAKAEADAELNGAGELFRETPPSRQFIRSIVAAAAVLVIAGIVASFFKRAPSPSPAISAGPNAAWSFTSGGLDQEKGFLPGSTIALDYGTLDIRLGTGTELLLEGPAELQLTKPDLVHLSDGRLWARAAGDQFTVETDQIKVVDLGTEFGVVASDLLDEEVHVKQGRVRVEPKHSSLDPMLLSSGEAVRTNAIGKLRRIPFSTGGFLTELPSSVPYQHWSFDELVDEEFPSTAFGMLESPIALYSMKKKGAPKVDHIQGRFGRALRMEGKATYARAGFEGIEGDVARTVALWIRATPPTTDSELETTLIAWGLATQFGTKWRLTLGRKGTTIGTVWGGAWATGIVPVGTSLLDGEWHHLAYVFSGRYTDKGHPEIYHFVDGVRLDANDPKESVPVNTECSAKHSRPLTLGSQIISKPSKDTFVGDIDELYIFRGALEDQQVRSLYESNQLTRGGQPAGPPPSN